MLTKSKIRNAMNQSTGRHPISDWTDLQCSHANPAGDPVNYFAGTIKYPTLYRFTFTTALPHESSRGEGLDFSVREIHNYLYGDIRTQAWEIRNRIKFGTREEALEVAEKLIELLEGD